MSVSARDSVILAMGGFATAFIAGCAINAEPDFDSAVPQERYLAIREAERTRDRQAVPELIRQLSVDDPLVRLAAIDALEAITDQTLGYDPNAREIERRAAIGRWVEWYESDARASADPEADQ